MPYEKTSAQKSIIGKGGVKSSRMSFYGRLRSGWMKSGHGGRGVKKGRKWVDVLCTRFLKHIIYFFLIKNWENRGW